MNTTSLSALSIPATVLMRIAVGIMFLMAGWGKVAAGSAWPGGMVGFLQRNAEKAHDWYWQFAQTVVIPNPAPFAYAVAYGEVLLGVALIFGAATRLASALGVFMVLNFMWAKGLSFWVPSNHDALYILMLGFLGLAAAGRSFGVDSWLRDRDWLPRILG